MGTEEGADALLHVYQSDTAVKLRIMCAFHGYLFPGYCVQISNEALCFFLVFA
jgi:hypothetical protein